MKQEYIAVHGLTNNGGIGIVEIDYSLGMVNFEVVVGGVVVDVINSQIIDYYNEEEECESGFMWGVHFIPFHECMRTNI